MLVSMKSCGDHMCPRCVLTNPPCAQVQALQTAIICITSTHYHKDDPLLVIQNFTQKWGPYWKSVPANNSSCCGWKPLSSLSNTKNAKKILCIFWNRKCDFQFPGLFNSLFRCQKKVLEPVCEKIWYPTCLGTRRFLVLKLWFPWHGLIPVTQGSSASCSD